MRVPDPILDKLETLPATLLSNSNETYAATLAIRRWSDSERRSRAFRRTFKIVGTICACSLIGLFVHILLLVILPALVLTFIFAFPLFQKFLGEDATLVWVEGQCPYCKGDKQLKPYLDTQFKNENTVQCPDCGQTLHVIVSL